MEFGHSKRNPRTPHMEIVCPSMASPAAVCIRCRGHNCGYNYSANSKPLRPRESAREAGIAGKREISLNMGR